MIIYLDESGDLGFDFAHKHPSKKFVIALLVCESGDATRGFKKAVGRTLKNKLNHHKKAGRVVSELKSTGTSLGIKRYFYRHSPKKGWRIYTMSVNKERVYDYLQTKAGKKKLYNFVARLLLEKVDLSKAAGAVTLIVDRCKNKDEISDFNQYLGNQLEALLPLDIRLNIYHQDSQENAGLQAVDLFCWGVFRKYEHDDLDWYREYSARIAFETEYLKDQATNTSDKKKADPIAPKIPRL